MTSLEFQPIRCATVLFHFGRTRDVYVATKIILLSSTAERWTKPNPAKKCTKQLRWECPSCSPNLKLTMPRLHCGAACDRPETNQILKIPPIPEVVWQQPTEIVANQDNLNNTNNDSTLKTDVASQTSPPKGTQQQSHVVATEQPSGKPNRHWASTVPWLLQEFLYRYPKYRTARSDYS